MQYRTFGSTGKQVSALGFGMMRLPLMDGGQGSFDRGGHQIDREKAIANLRYAIDHGVNYVDTAYNYMDGNSERLTGDALLDGYREKVFLATKSPVWLYESEADFDRLLDEQLERLHTDHIDFYLLHALSRDRWENKICKFHVVEKMQKAKAAGKIRYMGFSFHDDLDAFRTIVDGGPWDFCQIQLNYLDVEYQAGLAGLRYAADKGMGVVIMEPLRGGSLVNVAEPVADVFRRMDKKPVEGALDFLWDLPQVSLLLSGMGTMEQVEENITYADRSAVGMLTPQQRELVSQARTEHRKFFSVPCTACNYCSVCPQKVAIPFIFKAMNRYAMGEEGGARKDYRETVPQQGKQGDACVTCRSCEEICPQHISISEWMPKIHDLLG